MRARRRSPHHLAAAALAALALAACEKTATAPREPAHLRTLAAARGIAIGAAAGATFKRTDARGDTLRAILAREFSMIWSGTWLKFNVVHPFAASYDFTWADSMVAFARAHGQTVRGHVLVWHNQIPAWLTGGAWTPAQVDSILGDHTATVLGHFQGAIRDWDVVNEAVDDAGARRTTFWSAALGPGYIARAFRLARATDPTARLFYNDYNI